MTRLGLVGGAAIYHGFAFSGLLNGVASGQTLPEGWPPFPQSVDEACISVVWDEDRAAAERLARVFGIEHVVDTLEEVASLCDGVIVTDDGTLQHYRHAPYFLENGIPTFIDKPLAPDAETAAMLIDLAARHNAPLMSGSALRYATESEELRTRPNLLGSIQLATAVGPNELFYYGIHPLELAHSILGGGIRSVQNIGSADQDIVKVSYGDGRILMLMVARGIQGLFQLNLYGTEGHRQVNVEDATGFYANLLRQVIVMVCERKAPVPIQDALEVIRALEAAKQSLVTSQPIFL